MTLTYKQQIAVALAGNPEFIKALVDSHKAVGIVNDINLMANLLEEDGKIKDKAN